MAALQDRMLGRLRRTLEAAGLSGRTLVVVTGDHGLRTRAEYPPLPGGMADSISFRVPFLLHAPGVVRGTVGLPWLTSHIDVAPTLLDLLGVEAGRGPEQGLPMWDPRLAGRITFFLGRHYSGADAFHDPSVGGYFMWNHPTRTAYTARGALRFPPDSAHGAGTGPALLVQARLRRMSALQDALLRSILGAR